MKKIQFIITFEPVNKGENGSLETTAFEYILSNHLESLKRLCPQLMTHSKKVFFLLFSFCLRHLHSLLSRFLRLWLCFVLFFLLFKGSTSIFLLPVVLKFVCFSEFVRLLFFVASLFLLPPLFMFVFVGEFVIMSVSSFVFWDVPLLDALFEIDGLLLFVIPAEVYN